MLLSRNVITKNVGTLALAVGFVLTGLVGSAHADGPVFLTRSNGIQSTYPASNAFAVGTSTAPGQVATTTLAKLSVFLNPNDSFLSNSGLDGYRSAFEIGSTTTVGGTATTTADIFRVKNNGCVQLTATSSATQIYLVLTPLGATSTYNGTAYWKYGTCP